MPPFVSSFDGFVAKTVPVSLVNLGSNQKLDINLYYRAQADASKLPVLLLHGATMGANMFMRHYPDDKAALGYWLEESGFDPILVDWRCSLNVVDRLVYANEGSSLCQNQSVAFDLDKVAELDLPAIVAEIRLLRPDAKHIGIIGQCMGGGIISQSIASGHLGDALQAADLRLSHLVIMTLGLFYEVQIDGRLKTQDNILARLLAGKEPRTIIDPRTNQDFGGQKPEWPAALDNFYQSAKDMTLMHARSSLNETEELCNRLAFMYGGIFKESQLPTGLHELDSIKQFYGAMPTHFYRHGAQNVRRGWAAPYDAESSMKVSNALVSVAARDRFKMLDAKVTLLTGKLNRVWEHDSIDRMYEWLCRDQVLAQRCSKTIFKEYGHYDLFWGVNSPTEVFPVIREGLMG